MTRYELLKANSTLLEAIVNNGIDARDIKYIPLIGEYKAMRAKHHKVSFIVYHLSEKYDITERGIFKLLARMKKRVSL